MKALAFCFFVLLSACTAGVEEFNAEDGGSTDGDATSQDTNPSPATFPCAKGVDCERGQVCETDTAEGDAWVVGPTCTDLPKACAEAPTTECIGAALCEAQGGFAANDSRCGCDDTGCFCACTVP